ncbi:MAG: DUF421 domain-containing protein [Oscillospiraceae bacterium]|nr:DUF421 domain-containing protein [Oscillospiraceae bacterium]
MIVFFRAILLYLLIIFSMRLMGKRQLGELQPSELVATILISNIASLPIEDTAIPMATGAIPIIVLAGFEMILSSIALHCKPLRTLLSGRPVVLIKDGKLDQKAMKKMRFSIDDLLESLRGSGVFDLKDIWYAVVETNGKINVMQRFPAKTVTAEMSGLKGSDTAPPVVIISDGKILRKALPIYGITEQWIAATLRQEKISLQEVFLMTADENRQYLIVPREKKEERP